MGRLVALSLAVALVLGGAVASAAGVDDHEIKLPENAEVARGATSAVSLTIVPRPGFAISRDGPLVIELSAEPETGLAVPRRRYRRRDAADSHAEAPRFDLRVKGEAPGHYSLAIDLRFWVCGRKTCRPVRLQQTVDVTVSAPKDAGPPDSAPAPE